MKKLLFVKYYNTHKLKSKIREEEISRPYRCPVCNGNGIVPAGFYMSTSGQFSSSNVASEKCRSCNGTGIVWTPIL